jgi:ParB-like chromosome segregation protein Spo0J
MLAELKTHPLAELLPPMTEEEYAGLRADVRVRRGLLDPIILYEGQVLDGRHRYRACIELGIQPVTCEWDRKGSPLDFIIAKNLHRRHLTVGQRAMLADEIATMQQGARTDLAQICAMSQPEAAKKIRVSRSSAQMAREVRKNGVPAIVAAVKSGQMPLGRAHKIAKLSNEQQEVVLAQGSAPRGKRGHGGGNGRIRANGKRDERARRQHQKMEIWQTLHDALINLTNLPSAEDVAAIVQRHDRAGVTDHLPKAIEYLKCLEQELDLKANREKLNKSTRGNASS